MPEMRQIQLLIEQLASFPGVRGCALVDADTGMAWHYAGHMPDMEELAEASIEFWRVYKRLSAHFKDFGTFNSSAHSFSECAIALFPCGREPDLVMVCIANKSNMDWNGWAVQLMELKKLLVSAHQPTPQATTPVKKA